MRTYETKSFEVEYTLAVGNQGPYQYKLFNQKVSAILRHKFKLPTIPYLKAELHVCTYILI